VPVRYFTPSTPNLEGIKTVAGDFDKKELGKRINTAKLVGDIYSNWSRICPDRATIIFATNVKHSISIAEAFSRNGVEIAHIDAKTPPEGRERALDALKSGKIQVVTNVGILCEGYDLPKASCIVLARPTQSLGLYIQMAGRGLRTAEMKQDCILIDHGGCVERHGLLEWSREWSLDGKKKAWKTADREQKEKGMLKCIACHCVFTGTDTCPDCGSQSKTFGKKVETKDADLEELNKKKISIADKRIYLGMLKYWVNEKGYSSRMVTAKYKNKFGCWAHHSIADVAPITPDQKFINQMRHEQIKWAKRKEASNE
jgi:superfamily II DNA or RNA helicase